MRPAHNIPYAAFRSAGVPLPICPFPASRIPPPAALPAARHQQQLVPHAHPQALTHAHAHTQARLCACPPCAFQHKHAPGQRRPVSSCDVHPYAVREGQLADAQAGELRGPELEAATSWGYTMKNAAPRRLLFACASTQAHGQLVGPGQRRAAHTHADSPDGGHFVHHLLRPRQPQRRQRRLIALTDGRGNDLWEVRVAQGGTPVCVLCRHPRPAYPPSPPSPLTR